MKKTTKPPALPDKTETRQLKCAFTNEETLQMGRELAQCRVQAQGIAEEFDQVKATFKARQAMVDASAGVLSASINAGYELRMVRCRVEFDAKAGRKAYYAEAAPADALPLCVEDMTSEDYQVELLPDAASTKDTGYKDSEAIELWPEAGEDRGLMTVARGDVTGKWCAALSLVVGNTRLDERMGVGKHFKQRADAVKSTAERALNWIEVTLGAEVAQGFKEPIYKAIESHRERAE